MWPATFDQSTLQGLYAKIAQVYHDAGRGELMYFEPTQRDTIAFEWFALWQVMDKIWNVGFSSPPGASVYDNRHVLTERVSCCQLDRSA